MAVVAWPPSTPPDNRVNGTTAQDAHPDDHNLIADALDTLISRNGFVVWGADVIGNTDAFGNLLINLPAGARSVAVVATGSQVGYPHVINVNQQDFPYGGATVCVSVRNLDGSFVASGTVTVSVVVVYTV